VPAGSLAAGLEIELHMFAKKHSASVQTCLKGRDGELEDLGGLFICKALDIPQHHRSLQVCLQHFQTFL